EEIGDGVTVEVAGRRHSMSEKVTPTQCSENRRETRRHVHHPDYGGQIRPAPEKVDFAVFQGRIVFGTSARQTEGDLRASIPIDVADSRELMPFCKKPVVPRGTPEKDRDSVLEQSRFIEGSQVDPGLRSARAAHEVDGED